LRRVYFGFGVFVLIYVAIVAFEYSSLNKERLYRQLVTGNKTERASAGFDLAYLNGEAQLVRALKDPSSAVRLVAASSLWDLWSRAGGHVAFRRMQAANRAVESKSYGEALRLLGELTSHYPRFSEGWNRRATLYWEMGRFHEAIADARRAVSLNPNHFGAWQGMGLCYAHLGDMEEACRCIRGALRITPHDEELQTLLERCEKMLRSQPTRERARHDLI
jgi:tetratricopeptide (TPR) repeat protein